MDCHQVEYVPVKMERGGMETGQYFQCHKRACPELDVLTMNWKILFAVDLDKTERSRVVSKSLLSSTLYTEAPEMDFQRALSDGLFQGSYLFLGQKNN